MVGGPLRPLGSLESREWEWTASERTFPVSVKEWRMDIRRWGAASLDISLQNTSFSVVFSGIIRVFAFRFDFVTLWR